MPMAVGYSAGVINHFFRHRLKVSQDGEGILITNISNVPIAGDISIHFDDVKNVRWEATLKSPRINLGVGQSQRLTFDGDKSYLANAKDEFLYAVVTSSLFTSGPPIAHAVTRFNYKLEKLPKCDSQQVAGNNVPETRVIEMGKKSGVAKLTYETYTAKDRIKVVYENETLFDSGCVGTNGSWTKSISFSGDSSQMHVKIEPNCAGDSTGTEWWFNLACPE